MYAIVLPCTPVHPRVLQCTLVYSNMLSCTLTPRPAGVTCRLGAVVSFASPRLVPLRVSLSAARCPGAAGSGSCRCVCLVCVVVAACLVVFRGLVGWSVVSLVSGPVCVGLSRRRVAVGLSVWSGWGLAPFVSSARRVWFRLTPALSLVWLWAGVTASAPLGWPQTPGPWVTHSN